ncbi:DUF3768 domain-containing protein [Candidatus Saccharibacteria bacterium]|nr:DUF3768 domain-containing protein [Candidatus Saccharibacteria bacterium]
MSLTSRICALNDLFRRAACGPMIVNGQLVATRGVVDQGEDFLARAILAVRSFSDFTEDNDPYGEHDFGAFILDGQKLFWKIDYYDTDLKFHSPDPADPDVTRRVLTIMLASEY